MLSMLHDQPLVRRETGLHGERAARAAGAGYAQEAVLSGTVTDSTGGVLPGVTVTAVHEASGNIFEAVTDERGVFRLPVRIGTYRLTAQLAGFATVTRSGLELLVGQQAVVNLQMAPSGGAGVGDRDRGSAASRHHQLHAGGNIDPRQMQELPLNGRNWMDLALLAPGSKGNEGGFPTTARGTSQINVDGQASHSASSAAPMTINPGSAGMPSRSSSSSRTGLMRPRAARPASRSTPSPNRAPTRYSGLFSGYFRDDRFNAADFIQNRVLPYSNQQLSATFGGPIRRDKIHFFANYEYEREPQTVTYNSPYPSFNVDQTNTRREDKGGARLDVQFSPQTRLTARSNITTRSSSMAAARRRIRRRRSSSIPTAASSWEH